MKGSAAEMLELFIINQVEVGKTLKCALRFTQLDILLDLSSSDVGSKVRRENGNALISP